MDAGGSSADNTDYDDTFEDAPDPSTDGARKRSPDRIRSLTGKTPSIDSTLKSNRPESSAPPAGEEAPDGADKVHNLNGTQDGTATGNESNSSTFLAARRLSATSLDNVPLSGGKAASTTGSPSFPTDKGTEQTTTESAAPASSQASTKPAPSRFGGFSASLPSIPWGTAPAKSPSSTQPSPTPFSQAQRKTTGPFGWLGRGSSASKEIKSPTLGSSMTNGRRNTAASISTIGSNPELMLKNFEGGPDSNGSPSRPPPRTTLRDRFKMLRLREEAGVNIEGEPHEGGAIAGLIGRSSSVGLGIGSPASVSDEREGGPVGGTEAAEPAEKSAPKRSFTMDPDLAPGTVAGPAASSQVTPIDWDFWQSVVNEGPQAVARTNPEELTQAFVGGIPQTIRGVIWQILANSKNDDLEHVYRELVLRGTDKEIKEPPTPDPTSLTNGVGKSKSSVASSSSSIRSEHSIKAPSAAAAPSSPSPSQEKDPDTLAKIQASLAVEREQRSKEDAAALKKLEKMIKRDMGSRTSYSKYTTAAGLQDALFNVCKAYALFDEGVGYPQGMNFIIMPLLFNMPEEEAFCLLVRLMNKYGVRDLFIQDMPGLHVHLYQFERLLEDLEPALYCHLNRRGVTPKLYATQWFLTLFAYRFPLQLVMRVYDLILSEGLEGAILKFGMAVLQRNVTTLLGMNDMLEITNFLKEKLFDVYIDKAPSSKSILESGFFGSSGGSDAGVYRADLLVQDAAAIKLTAEMLNRYRLEWDEKVRQEKEREAELENYRTTVATQSMKIRQLEERTEKSDAEHVQIASELVRLKVDNEELNDKNESLGGQVDELKKVAESEAKNVEDRLREEMQRVMQRNSEVQNENRHLQDTMAQMEKDLVDTKIQYAEINENYENLKQKWNDLRKALD